MARARLIYMRIYRGEISLMPICRLMHFMMISGRRAEHAITKRQERKYMRHEMGDEASLHATTLH